MDMNRGDDAQRNLTLDLELGIQNRKLSVLPYCQ